MLTAQEQRMPDLIVRVRRRRDRSRIDKFAKLFERFRGSDAILLRNRVGTIRIYIVNGGKFRRRNLRIKPGVIAPDVADANDANAHFLHVVGAAVLGGTNLSVNDASAAETASATT